MRQQYRSDEISRTRATVVICQELVGSSTKKLGGVSLGTQTELPGESTADGANLLRF
jgi:hypothetical protein